jgi:hypothetical protein
MLRIAKLAAVSRSIGGVVVLFRVGTGSGLDVVQTVLLGRPLTTCRALSRTPSHFNRRSTDKDSGIGAALWPVMQDDWGLCTCAPVRDNTLLTDFPLTKLLSLATHST